MGLDALVEADTIILPAAPTPTAPIPDDVLDALRHAAANGTRIASICSGAFILAATGLLDGHRATTHWLAAGTLAELHPKIEMDPDVLYVDNGQFLTSAGAAAGLDLCLHLIRRDHGSPVAADAAAVGNASGTRREAGLVHRPRSTTLLDPYRYPATELVRLYHERWEIETAYLELKSSILGGRVLRARTPTGVAQEV